MTQPTEQSAHLIELFSSAQGEGVHIGRRQLFVRFCDCHRNCIYCDTPVKRPDAFSIERDPGSGSFDTEPNPVSVNHLLDLVTELNRPELVHNDLFITGGEPLLHADFLTEFLPRVREKTGLPIHLETSGDLVEPFKKIKNMIDYVLMDIKLPSVTGEPETWEQHHRFMNSLHKNRILTTIKMVVNADTSDQDLAESVELITASGICAHVVLQPMTAALKTDRIPTAKQVLKWQSEMACSLGHPVRIIPQCHKLMGLL